MIFYDWSKRVHKAKRQARVSWMEVLRADSIRVNGAGGRHEAVHRKRLRELFTPYPLLVVGMVGGGLALVIWVF